MTSQPKLPGIDTDYIGRAAAISKRASKQRRRLPVLQPELVADRWFTPRDGVPATRADCPPQRFGGLCDRVRCRFNLLMEDAEHRAGRPGLSSVKRDRKGLTLSQPGDAGAERAGTTLRPAWLKVRGLEMEREVSVWLHPGEDGLTVNEANDGTLDYWLKYLLIGERIVVVCNDNASPWYKQALAHAVLTPGGEIKFDRYPESMFVILRRARPVSSCALDEIDANGKMTNEQVGAHFARHRTLIARVNRAAVKKAERTAKSQGIERSDFLQALQAMGADRER